MRGERKSFTKTKKQWHEGQNLIWDLVYGEPADSVSLGCVDITLFSIGGNSSSCLQGWDCSTFLMNHEERAMICTNQLLTNKVNPLTSDWTSQTWRTQHAKSPYNFMKAIHTISVTSCLAELFIILLPSNLRILNTDRRFRNCRGSLFNGLGLCVCSASALRWIHAMPGKLW